MKLLSLAEELRSNSYPGRGIVIGRSKDGAKAVTAYFIMGRSENSRNRVFVEEGEGSAPRPSIRQSFPIPALSSMRRSVSWAIRPL